MVWILQHYTGKSLPWFQRFEIKSAVSQTCFILLAPFFKVWTHRVFLLWVWMIFRSYFPDSRGKSCSEMNNELCFFITVVRAAFHENVHSKYWYSQRYFDDTEMMRPKQVQLLLYKITRDFMNSMYRKVTTLLFPRNNVIYLPSSLFWIL